MNNFLTQLPIIIATLSKAVLKAIKEQILEVARIIQKVIQSLWLIYRNIESSILGTIVDIGFSIIALRYFIALIVIGAILFYFAWWLALFIYVVVIIVAVVRFFSIPTEGTDDETEAHIKRKEKIVGFLRLPIRILFSLIMLFITWYSFFVINYYSTFQGKLSTNQSAPTAVIKIEEESRLAEERSQERIAREQAEERARIAEEHQIIDTAPRKTDQEQTELPKSGLPVTSIPTPVVQVGDSYTYESIDADNPGLGTTTKRTITSNSDKIILSVLNIGNTNAKPRNLYFTNEWNLMGTRNSDNSGYDYSPPLKYFDFPLYPDKAWQQTTTETNIKTRATRTHKISGLVGQWEDISVPAGTFRAIKVSLQTELFDPTTGEKVNGTDVSWYVPEIRRSVKSLTTGKDEKKQMLQLVKYEVKSDLPEEEMKKIKGSPSIRELEDPIVGRWTWFTGDRHEFLPEGKIAGNPNSYWALIDNGKRLYRIAWGCQWIDIVTVSNKSISGTNQIGVKVTGTKLENTLSSEDPIVGRWTWFTGDRHEFLPEGKIAGNPNSYWALIDNGKRLYRIAWGCQWIDIVTVSNKSISGTNQIGVKVTGTKLY